MADINEAYELQKINNIKNPYVMVDNSKYSDFGDDNYSLNGTDDLTHNNMQPYFRKKNYGTDYKQTVNVFQTKTDLFSGSRNQVDWAPKKEVEKLFKPAEYGGYVYGRPVQTELFKSRYIPSMQRNGEKPFQEIRVQPGLNLGLNESSHVGFHDPYRAMPKNVDELRTANKPKLSYNQPVVQGLKSSIGPKAIDKVNKKKPEKFKALGTYPLNPSRASFSMPSIYGRTNPMNLSKTNNRGASKNDGQVSGAYLPTNQNIVDGIHSEPLKQNFLQDSPTNVAGYKLNQIYNLEDLDPTKRDIHNYDDLSNIGASNNSKHYIFDKNGTTPNYTLRDIYKIQDINGIISSHSQNSKSYIYDLDGTIPETTLRNLYNYEDFGNVGIGKAHKSYIFDSDGLTPDYTLRDVYKTKDNDGIAGFSNNSLSYAYDTDGLTPEYTKRDMHKYKDLNNVVANSKSSYIYDKDGTKPINTNRNMYKVKDIYGAANGSSFYKPTTREDVNNMTISDSKEQLNLSYKKPETVQKTKFQLGFNHHLKEEKGEEMRFNPAGMRHSLI